MAVALKRQSWNLLVDLFAAATAVGLLATGYIIKVPLPPRTNQSLKLWGLTRHQWGEIHFWLSIAFLAILAVHIVLHWNWIVGALAHRLGSPAGRLPTTTGAGIWTLLVVGLTFGGFAWLVHSGVEPLTEAEREHHGQGPAAGSTTAAAELSLLHQSLHEIVSAIIQRHCLSCHGSSRQAAGIRLDRLEQFAKGNGQTPLIVPGHSSRSLLVEVVSGQRPAMKLPDRHRLSDGDVAVIKAWIDAQAH